MALTARREKFAQMCAAGKSASDAYRACFNVSNFTEKSVWSTSSKIANLPDVKLRIEELRAAAHKKATDEWVFDTAAARRLVLEDALAVLQADPSDLVTYRRLNCRHCHGTGHAYRWRDEAEYWAALAEASDKQQQWDERPADKRSRKRPELPTEDGGYGFRTTAPPDPGCPKCEGEGIPDARIADIRTVTGPARSLYAGLEMKKDGGIKLNMRSKEAARELLARHTGVLVDKVLHGGAVGLVPMQLSDTERAAILKLLESDI